MTTGAFAAFFTRFGSVDFRFVADFACAVLDLALVGVFTFAAGFDAGFFVVFLGALLPRDDVAFFAAVLAAFFDFDALVLLLKIHSRSKPAKDHTIKSWRRGYRQSVDVLEAALVQVKKFYGVQLIFRGNPYELYLPAQELGTDARRPSQTMSIYDTLIKMHYLRLCKLNDALQSSSSLTNNEMTGFVGAQAS